MTHCILCRAPLPPDRRWAITRYLNPRPPFCSPPTETCYRGLAAALGHTPSDDEVAAALAAVARRNAR